MVQPPKLGNARGRREPINAMGALDWAIQPEAPARESFPPGKSEDEIAFIVAELGAELGAPPASAPDYDTPTCELEAAAIQEVLVDDVSTSFEVSRIEFVEDVDGSVVDASFVGANLIEESIVELAPDILVDEPDDEPMEVSVIELVDATADDDIDDIETMRPMRLNDLPPRRSPHALTRRPPPLMQGVVPGFSWTSRDETTSTDLFVA